MNLLLSNTQIFNTLIMHNRNLGIGLLYQQAGVLAASYWNILMTLLTLQNCHMPNHQKNTRLIRNYILCFHSGTSVIDQGCSSLLLHVRFKKFKTVLIGKNSLCKKTCHILKGPFRQTRKTLNILFFKLSLV